MPLKFRSTPGTVSRILWHFTGGPTWNSRERRQNRRPKPSAQAYKNLRSILHSRELRLGGYRELIRVEIPEHRYYSRSRKKYVIEKKVTVELQSSPVCCLADIPIAHLAYHASRYGKFAIGFHRDAVISHGFNPVFYTLEASRLMHSIYEGLTSLAYVDASEIITGIDMMEEAIGEANAELVDCIDTAWLDEIGWNAESMAGSAQQAYEAFQKFTALIKTFRADEFDTIYCEREWRALKTFRFSPKDVALIVIPRIVGKARYFAPFRGRVFPDLGIPDTVPVVPWEDLVEH